MILHHYGKKRDLRRCYVTRKESDEDGEEMSQRKEEKREEGEGRERKRVKD